MALSKNEMRMILDSFAIKKNEVLDFSLKNEWKLHEAFFGCEFSDEFKNFVELITKEYDFPGAMLGVSLKTGDTIMLVYQTEKELGFWNDTLIPFFGIRNGDYFCIMSAECPDSGVYYYYHDNLEIEKHFDTFEEWVRDQPKFYLSDESI